MQDLRLIERRDHTLILQSHDGSEFTLEATAEVITAVQSISRSIQTQASEVKVKPREVQSLLRGGASPAQVAEQLGIELGDVERYAGPIDAEFSFILQQALGVPVRADSHVDDELQLFGEVVEQRLEQLGATQQQWRTWRDPEEGWMVATQFSSHGVDHDAQWAFEHRKKLLSPVTPDAVNLSKQGDVGNKLIPTLRAVDRPDERTAFATEPFEQASAPAETPEELPSTPTPEFTKSDFERRLGIEQRAIASEPEPQDLGQTSDLLDALRKRRHDRDAQEQEHAGTPDAHDTDAAAQGLKQHTETPPGKQSHDSNPLPNIWMPPAAPTAAPPASQTSVADALTTSPLEPAATPAPAADLPATGAPDGEAQALSQKGEKAQPAPDERPAKKGRQSIPSWDEILFGTRSEED